MTHHESFPLWLRVHLLIIMSVEAQLIYLGKKTARATRGREEGGDKIRTSAVQSWDL